MKRIFILASERSGTNLLRVLLGRHKDISAPVAVHFFNTFRNTIPKYGNLLNKENSNLLIDHFLRSANHSYTDWNLEYKADFIVDEFGVNSFESAFDAIYRAKAKSENKIHYVSKDNDLYDHIDIISKLPTESDQNYFINLYRDPRDQAVSWLKTPLFLHTVYDIAHKWNKEQNKINEVKKDVRTFDLSYEELISNTEEKMTQLLNYLELEIDPNCFTTDKKNIEANKNPLWKNLSKPILGKNQKKYKTELKRRQIAIIETICDENMKRLGYESESDLWPARRLNFYRKYLLSSERKFNMRKNKKFYDKNMSKLESKLKLLDDLKHELNG